MSNDETGTKPTEEHPPGKGELDDDGMVSDIIKRAIMSGFRTVSWGSEKVGAVGEKVGAVGSTLNSVRQEVVGVAGREIVRYLDGLNLTEEAVKVLTSISLELRTEIRFIPNDKKLIKPDIKNSISVKAAKESADDTAKPKRRRPRRKKKAEEPAS
ncbi:MAG: hypothetical protein ACI9WU_003586 [Myxococcota bacterium]|jgi:hypothetical protein